MILKILNGDQYVEEKGLCASCAIKYISDKNSFKNIEYIDKKLLDALEEMRNLICSIVTNIGKISTILTDNVATGSVCSNCGMSYNEFKERGFFGCPDCYMSFREYINEIVLGLERDRHIRVRCLKGLPSFT